MDVFSIKNQMADHELGFLVKNERLPIGSKLLRLRRRLRVSSIQD